jgi:eukaryotic-like serine/threonine-protein kinase
MKDGAHIDRFQVEATIGVGGMATVYRVRHRQLHTRHALKMLKIRSPALADRLLQEGRIQAGLKHPNVVAVADVVEHQGEIGLLMELVEGSSLEDCLREGPMLYDEALEIFRQVLAGMAAAHAAGVTHRDLKPANILLATEGGRLVAKVTDFGIAKVIRAEEGTDGTRTGMGMGTPGYMAPEQVTDAAGVDLRADVFALGAIFYEMLSGRRAFKGVDQLDTLNRTVKGVYAPLARVVPGIPLVVDAVVRRALSVRREDRFPDCPSMVEALRAAPSAASSPRSLRAEGSLGANAAGLARSASPSPAPLTPSPGDTPSPERPLLDLKRLAERRNARLQLETAVVDDSEPVKPPPSVIAEAWGRRRSAALDGLAGERPGEDASGAYDTLRSDLGTTAEDPAARSKLQELGGALWAALVWIVTKGLRAVALPLGIVLLVAWAFASRTGSELKQVDLERQAQVFTFYRAVDDSLQVLPELIAAGANSTLIRSLQQKYEGASDPMARSQAARELSTVLLQELSSLPPAVEPEEEARRRRLEASILVLDREAARYAELARKQERLSDSVAGRIARWMRLAP